MADDRLLQARLDRTCPDGVRPPSRSARRASRSRATTTSSSVPPSERSGSCAASMPYPNCGATSTAPRPPPNDRPGSRPRSSAQHGTSASSALRASPGRTQRPRCSCCLPPSWWGWAGRSKTDTRPASPGSSPLWPRRSSSFPSAPGLLARDLRRRRAPDPRPSSRGSPILKRQDSQRENYPLLLSLRRPPMARTRLY